MREKNFVLGVGCQKGGTSWLHAQLQKSINVDMGFIKEYHVFDALYVDDCKGFLTRKLEKLSRAAEQISSITSVEELGQLNKEHSELLAHVNFYLDTDNYFNYFDCLWQQKAPDVTTVGDISPTYGTIPADAFKAIKNGLESRGFNVKVVFLMRDPIERCWSALRMKRREKLKRNPNARLNDEQAHLGKYYKTRHCEIRSRYELTVRNLEGVFDAGNIFYGFYETLFEEQTLSALKAFLNLPDFSPDVNERVNVSEKTEHRLQQSLANEIFDHYKDTYAFCDDRFDVRGIWNGWSYR